MGRRKRIDPEEQAVYTEKQVAWAVGWLNCPMRDKGLGFARCFSLPPRTSLFMKSRSTWFDTSSWKRRANGAAQPSRPRYMTPYPLAMNCLPHTREEKKGVEGQVKLLLALCSRFVFAHAPFSRRRSGARGWKGRQR